MPPLEAGGGAGAAGGRSAGLLALNWAKMDLQSRHGFGLGFTDRQEWIGRVKPPLLSPTLTSCGKPVLG